MNKQITAIETTLTEAKILLAICDQIVLVWKHADSIEPNSQRREDAIRQAQNVLETTLQAVDTLMMGMKQRHDGMSAAWSHVDAMLKAIPTAEQCEPEEGHDEREEQMRKLRDQQAEADAHADDAIKVADKHGLLEDES